ncbi:MAG: LLM class F420-dependent oxidoreductase [Ilumatobacteraceae bacterium]|nr:LLM class F420-dependent oxidoreductase [Ilumatobacteraceae bacterium]
MDGSRATGAPPAIGITLMLTDRSIHPTELAREVEARGFESLFLPEHSHIPTSRRTPWPGSLDPTTPLPDYYARLVDQTVSLAMAAAVTERLVLGTAVTLVAQHDPIWLAKQVATLDALSGGRVLIGAGFGWNREEAESHGVVHGDRRRLVEEHVALMRTLWRDEVAEFRGELVSLEPSWAWPKPARPEGPPVLLGGGTGPVLLDAIVRWADGWMPITARPSLGDRLERLRAAWTEAGRDPDRLQIAVMGATTDPAGLEQLGREGVQRAVLTIWSEDRDEILRTLDELAELPRRLHG